jgi:8-oxo-dGTP pyrophosphatase MutT (NUDIX family)
VARSLILNPQSVPVIGTDAHLPAVEPSRLQAEALRERFRTTGVWEPEFAGDGRNLRIDRPPAPASVLVPIVTRASGPQVLLTRRTEHLRDHAGQISFPGGRQEEHDADVIATALRETEEEVGLARSYVDVIGTLPPYATVTGFVVTPVVALVQPPFDLALDSFEVAEAFEVPLAFLMDPANHHRHQMETPAGPRSFYSMPWEGLAPDGQPRHYFIWGATAAMLRNFYRYLAR